LPQFVDLNSGHVAIQITVLGLVYITLGLITDGAYAFAAGVTSGWLKRSPRFLAGERYVSGTLLIGLGVTAAFSGSRGKL
jgi:threonine/homoserine/homoserine lactone efflux protein